MTKSEFLKSTQPVTISVAGVPAVCPPRRFKVNELSSEQSVGFNYNAKVDLPAGTEVVQVSVGGFPLAAIPTKKNPNNYYGAGKVLVNGQQYQVGANITRLESGRYTAGVNAIAVKSKSWEEGAAAPAKQAATAALSAPTTVPAGRTMTRAEAEVAFLAESKLPKGKLKADTLTKGINRWASTNGVTISG